MYHLSYLSYLLYAQCMQLLIIFWSTRFCTRHSNSVLPGSTFKLCIPWFFLYYFALHGTSCLRSAVPNIILTILTTNTLLLASHNNLCAEAKSTCAIHLLAIWTILQRGDSIYITIRRIIFFANQHIIYLAFFRGDFSSQILSFYMFHSYSIRLFLTPCYFNTFCKQPPGNLR